MEFDEKNNTKYAHEFMKNREYVFDEYRNLTYPTKNHDWRSQTIDYLWLKKAITYQ